MPLWSRGIVLLILVANLPSRFGAFKDSTEQGSSSEQTEVKIETRDKGPPTGISLGCNCDFTDLQCSCGINANLNLIGYQLTFNPHINLKLITSDMALEMSITSNGRTLVQDQVIGILEEEKLPSICIPLPQFPIIEMCIESDKVLISRRLKSMSICLKFSLNFVSFRLHTYPTLPIGCFLATKGRKLRYSLPAFPDTVKKPIKRVLSHKFGQSFKFDLIPSIGEWAQSRN